MKDLILGLTGSIGSGKSTVSHILESEYGFFTVDADKAAHAVTGPGSPVLAELAAEFGGDILENGILNRKLLASRAFSSEASTERLNAITHPHILERMREELENLPAPQKRRVVIDAPLLFEAGLDRLCGAVLSITAPYDIQLRRVMERDGCTREEVLRRLERQHPADFYRDRSSHVIDNGGSLEDLKSELKSVILELRGGGFDV